MFPTPPIAGDWTESISAMLTESRIGSLELEYMPDPARAVLNRFVSSRIDGTVSESVTPRSGTKVSLMRPEGTQKWWMVEPGDSILAELDGSERARLEFRLVLPPGTREPGRYVVQVSIDGKPHDWRVFKATPDSTVHLPETGLLIGDRDRMELALSSGPHRVAVRLLAGTGVGLLARIRRPE